jgi:predicted dehydrogenase
MSEKNKSTEKDTGIGRRELLKGLATVPVLGVFAYNYLRKQNFKNRKKQQIVAELGLDDIKVDPPCVIPSRSGDRLRLGIIGYGGRGQHLLRGAGFAHPDWIKEKAKQAAENSLNTELQTFMEQEDLNVEFTAVCDLFETRLNQGVEASENEISPIKTKSKRKAKAYRYYQDLLESKDVDMVIIATPDHWHAPIAINAAQAKKHIYLEKCITRTEEEVYQVTDAVKESGVVFQLGHQNHQSESHLIAQQVIKKNILGNITLVETTTNRNSPGGAWVWDIPKEANPRTVDWQQFQLPAPHKVPFSLERFFRWRCWFDYGTGLAGDLLSHEYAAINQILQLGIPKTAAASGGIYHYKDGRDVPDVFHVVLEYPERNLSIVYSATLANGNWRGRVIMGQDATMNVGEDVLVSAEMESERYRDKIENGIIDLSLPLFSYKAGAQGVDAVTSATEKYFSSKGLFYTYRQGKCVDATHLHVKDWIDSIRARKTPMCHIDFGFEEGIACHMATQAYLKGRKVEWDPVKKRIV